MDLFKDYNLSFKNTKEPECFKFKNPILNGIFNGYGLPVGKRVQFVSESGTGKTTLLLQMAKELCDSGKKVVYIDAENGLNLPMLQNMGLVEHLNSQNFCPLAENDCTRVNNLLNDIADKTDDIEYVFIDSIAALDSGMYRQGGVEANNPKVGGNTKSIKIIMNTISSITIRRDNITFVLVNHIIEGLGMFQADKPAGGNSPVYMSDFLIKLSRKGSWEVDKVVIGSKVTYEAIKSRWGAGKSKVSFYIRYGYGISLLPTYRDALQELDTTFNGEKHKYIESKGGGYGSLYLNDVEYKFRGEKESLKIVGEHYSEISKIFENKPELFKVLVPETIDDIFESETKSDIVLPEDFKGVKIIATEGRNAVLFDDKNGNKIVYKPLANKLSLYYNADEIEIIMNPDFEDYKNFLDRFDTSVDSVSETTSIETPTVNKKPRPMKKK